MNNVAGMSNAAGEDMMTAMTGRPFRQARGQVVVDSVDGLALAPHIRHRDHPVQVRLFFHLTLLRHFMLTIFHHCWTSSISILNMHHHWRNFT
jgi:hypothetical protein